MTQAVPLGPPSRISEPSSYTRVFGRYNGLAAPAQVAAFSNGSVVVAYEGLDQFPGVFARLVGPAGPLSSEIVCDGARSASVIVPPYGPGSPYEFDFIVAAQELAHGPVLANWYDGNGNNRGAGAAYLLVEGYADPSSLHKVTLVAPTIGALPGGQILVACSRTPTAHLTGQPTNVGIQISTFDLVTEKPPVPLIMSAQSLVKGAAGSFPSGIYNGSVQAAYTSPAMLVWCGVQPSGEVWAAAARHDGSQFTGFDLGFGTYPTIARLSDSRCIVVWQAQNQIHYSIHDVQDAFPSIAPVAVASGQANQSKYGNRPAVAVLASGQFIVVWEEYGLQGRIFSADGSPATDQFELHGERPYVATPSIAATPSGGFYVAYMCDDGVQHPPVLPATSPQWFIQGQAWSVT